MSPPTQSEIWIYFKPDEYDQDKAHCKICNKIYSRKGRTTTSLKNHLKSMHPGEFSLFENLNKKKQLQKIKADAGVHKEPCLWNPLHPDYREMHIKEWAWQRVVKHFNNSAIPNVQVAKIEWKKLRDNHRDALKRAKLGKNKLLPAQITTWKYAKAMQFLEPHMKYRITEHIEMEPPAGSNQRSTEQDVSTTETTENVPTDNLSPINKRRCLERSNDYRQDKDALESFFNCILQSTRSMPHWMQTQVKKKIFAVIIDAEECLSSQDRTAIDSKDNILPIETEIKSEVFSDDTSCDNE